MNYYSDLSLTGPLNLAYDDGQNKEFVPYAFFYPTVRKQDHNKLTFDPNQPVTYYYYVGNFVGNTSKSVTLYYNPPACLRIIDHEIESDNVMLPLYLRVTSGLSDAKSIHFSPNNRSLDSIYTQEQKGSWCYYFEKADLARQKKDWETVVDIAKIALNLEDHPNDPAEKLPFIEGYAHVDDWSQAKMLSMGTLTITPAMKPVLCKLWQRINAETSRSLQKEQTFAEITN